MADKTEEKEWAQALVGGIGDDCAHWSGLPYADLDCRHWLTMSGNAEDVPS